ncbi:hypothetical protein Q5P01_007049 [Channa striata]|uniref:Immunoglobulin domain-containing protein n=1 Tax=Channa striata TaxID=64152 RepID=A0AA88N401_CHASR|nr:hypothetical protein Q5P01_007049 [Channa striata]
MKVVHALVCCFLLSLQDGNFNLVDAQTFTRIKGGEITVTCRFRYSGTRKLFCKDPCNENILIETTHASAQSGRYSISYAKGDSVSVSITQLTKVDTGQYKCVLDKSSILFGIIVVDALLGGNHDSSEDQRLYSRAGENLTVACYFTHTGRGKLLCKDPCEQNVLAETDGDTDRRGRHSIRYVKTQSKTAFVHVTITQLEDSDSGWYWCGLDSTHRGFEIVITGAPSKPTQSFTSSGGSTPSYGLPKLTDQSGEQQTETNRRDDAALYIGLAVVLTVLLLSVLLLMVVRKRSSKPKGDSTEHPHNQAESSEREYASIPEPNQVYEEIRGENIQSRAPPAEISAVYPHVKYGKPNGAEDNDAHSCGSAATSQHKDEDEMSKLTYCEVDFSNRTTSSNGVPRGGVNEVIYSVPRLAAGVTGLTLE